MNEKEFRQRIAEAETATKKKIAFVLYKRRGRYALAACRGLWKGCNIQKKQREKMGPCENCMPCENGTETLGQVIARLSGDA